ncbi:hypothetical protein JW906_01040 [bacterium]|nr:hypothetical protein [bacterium]
MKKQTLSTLLAAITIFLAAGSEGAHAQAQIQTEKTSFAQRNLSGPRLGITYLPGNRKLVQELEDKKVGKVLSQFGWHFEHQIIPEGGGPSFVVELVPLIAGVEYGTLIPTASLAMGIRFPGGIEFGLGPNILIGTENLHTSLVIAFGKSFNYSGVSIPLNLVCATSPDGNRFSFIFGYAVNRPPKSGTGK